MKTDFQSRFGEVQSFLAVKGIIPTISSAPPATVADINRFTHETGIQLPSSFADFFTTFSNGYYFGWLEVGGSEECGEFLMPDLSTLASVHREWSSRIEEFASDPHSMDHCVKPEFRDKAFGIWRRMKGWLPLITDEGGDSFCLDLTNGAVVFDKQDWFDGFGENSQANGMIAGSSLGDFLQLWGRFCFRPQFFADAPNSAYQTHLEWIGMGSEFERV